MGYNSSSIFLLCLQAIFFFIIICHSICDGSSRDNRLQSSSINPHDREEGGLEIPVEAREEQLLLCQQLLDPLSLLWSLKASRAIF